MVGVVVIVVIFWLVILGIIIKSTLFRVYVLLLLYIFLLIFSEVMDILYFWQLFRQTWHFLWIIQIWIFEYLLYLNPLIRVICKHLLKQSECCRICYTTIFHVLSKLTWAIWTLDLQELFLPLDSWPYCVVRLTQLLKNGDQMLFTFCILILTRYRLMACVESEDKIASEHVLKHTSQGPNVDPVRILHV